MFECPANNLASVYLSKDLTVRECSETRADKARALLPDAVAADAGAANSIKEIATAMVRYIGISDEASRPPLAPRKRTFNDNRAPASAISKIEAAALGYPLR